MKLRKHQTGVDSSGGYLSLFAILQINNLNKKTMDNILEFFKDSHIIEYCLFVGRFSMINNIIDKIKDRYMIQWIGDNHCLVSRNSYYNHYVPRSEILYVKKDRFLISIRGVLILYITKLNKLNEITDKDDIHIVCSCDEKYDPEKDPESIGWTYHPNHPTFHTFVNVNHNLSIHDYSVRVADEGPFICNIFIPYWQIESVLQSMVTQIA